MATSSSSALSLLGGQPSREPGFDGQSVVFGEGAKPTPAAPMHDDVTVTGLLGRVTGAGASARKGTEPRGASLRPSALSYRSGTPQGVPAILRIRSERNLLICRARGVPAGRHRAATVRRMEWTAETWRAYRNYADEVMVQVRFLDETDQDRELDATWVILAHGAKWDQDWLLQRVEALGRVPESGEPRFILETRENRLSWGAETASLQIILTVGGMVLGSALEVAFDRLGDGRRTLEGWGRGEPLNEQEAVARTRWIMVQRFGLNDEELRLQSVEIEPPEQGMHRSGRA